MEAGRPREIRNKTNYDVQRGFYRSDIRETLKQLLLDAGVLCKNEQIQSCTAWYYRRAASRKRHLLD